MSDDDSPSTPSAAMAAEYSASSSLITKAACLRNQVLPSYIAALVAQNMLDPVAFLRRRHVKKMIGLTLNPCGGIACIGCWGRAAGAASVIVCW